MDQKKTGQFLKTLRNEKNLTQEQLAKKFGVTSRSVSRWETGSNLPDISLLVEIADFYDVDVREIIDGERKSEMMDKEIREVADKMAVYAGNEKQRFLRLIQVLSIVGVAAAIISIILQTISYEPDFRRFLAILATFAGFIIMTVVSLYVTGLLKRLAKNKKAVKAIGITLIVIAGTVTAYILMFYLVLLLALASMVIAPIEHSNDPAIYAKYINNNGKELEGEYTFGNDPMFDIMPRTIDVKPDEFSLMYYNPWDPQYIIYFTLDLKDGYGEEIERLKTFGVEDYKGIYTVTGEPEGYDLVAMDSDEYSGFVYAMIPEGDPDNTRITYVAIVFCNFMLDVDVEDYLPEKYLLPGFDATSNNPHRKYMEEKMGVEQAIPGLI